MIFLSLFWAFFASAHMSYAQESTLYSENITLEVVHNQSELNFLGNGETLFKIPEHEMLNFIQVAKDLENFDIRLQSMAGWLKGLTSAYLAIATGGTAGIVAITGVSMVPGPEKNESIERLANNDLNYFAANPKFYSQSTIPKMDLLEMIKGLQLIYQEYQARLGSLLALQEKIDSASDQELSCDFARMSYLEPTQRKRQSFTTFQVTKLETESGLAFSFRQHPNSLEPYWVPSDSNDEVARVYFNKRTLGIKKLVIGYQDYPGLLKKEFNLGEVLASVGQRTRKVNTKLISHEQGVPIAYKWSMILRSCLQQGQPSHSEELVSQNASTL